MGQNAIDAFVQKQFFGRSKEKKLVYHKDKDNG